TAIMFAYEAASARAQDAYPVEQDQAVRGVDPAGTYWINDDWLHRLHGDLFSTGGRLRRRTS
ncbi:hypothetical protein, partial [Methyloceanibacter sp.]|uniref:hypothetical protein n=1 Tax=Methyloceanibacter sp. TaxID=1965321 RepID=UPI00351BA3F0